MSCSSISYKRGATPEEMTKDENICFAESILDSEFQSCMRNNGWFIADASAIVKTIEVTKNLTEAKALRQHVGVRKKNSKIAERIAIIPDVRTEVDLVEPKVNQGNNNKIMRSIASWWKIGDTANNLERDMAECAGRLGEINHSESGTALFSDGMTNCLKARGWRGIGI
ncbi:MAG TPA: hypothetical protein DGR97_07580 [Gammaproteobacteria bacterium]|nr:hypothetical protein [Gammaproteobacteria bacterium]|tara:strand:- start:1718 stop:2224 length:507 start_codon:yes stop_codon:yes gene_type:complete